MKRLLISLLAISAFYLPLAAQESSAQPQTIDPSPIVRIGWGDMMFESASWRDNSQNCNYRHIGHFFGEFQYPILNWLSAGIKADYSTVRWDIRKTWDTPVIEKGRNFSNISFIPEIRFTYYRKGIVEMYSSLGMGLNINTGSELDWKGRRTACAPAFDITAYGISVGCKNWFASAEIGALNSFTKPKLELYMLCSRLFSVSIGYRL